MLVISQKEVVELLSMEGCIDAMEAVLADLATGQAMQSLRQMLPLAEGNLLGLMPGYLRRDGLAGAKLITISPGNHSRGLPSHQGVVTLFDASSGVIKAIMDGQKITAIRTAAVSAAATRHLARADAEVLAILGTGEQAASHLEAMLQVRELRQVRIWGRTPSKAAAWQAEMSSRFSVEITVCATVREAVAGADIICAVTAATEPVLLREWVKPGAHINAVGACRPTDRELDSELVAQSRLYVDSVESAAGESGDYLIPLAEGAIPQDHIVGEIGAVFSGQLTGRATDSEITLFKSLGLAVEDLAAAQYIYNKALRLQRGTEIAF
ncbi:ornithine cyclodeaminase family protein [Paenibacillus donghaensis]|uniref:Ornithine cyclodeaminase n=1 Tax=Paenibacillus donghaensis TaxID=414771 RepID=A0A2Z2KQR3_9BACL|nr:ornithine cyclodeaminase family protein [Paenibacillus donghaensis]ASA23722.1 hypothetical protein B9T62_24790 [Paenibacillus donghaensis]